MIRPARRAKTTPDDETNPPDIGATGIDEPDEPEIGPLRRCIVTRERDERARMLRFVVGPDRTVVPDLLARLPGRGIWLSARRDVLDTARMRGAFNRAARGNVSVPPDLTSIVEAGLLRRVVELLGLARRAGQAVAGFGKARDWIESGRAGLAVQAADGSVDERRRFLSGARDMPVVAPLDAATLGSVFGRDHVVHVVVATGRLAESLMIEAGRLAGVAAGMPPCVAPTVRAARDRRRYEQGMSEGSNNQDTAKRTLSLRPAGRSDVPRTVDGGSVRQQFSHGRTKTVQVEVVKKRAGAAAPAPAPAGAPSSGSPRNLQSRPGGTSAGRGAPGTNRALTQTEQAARQRAVAGEAARREQLAREQEAIKVMSAAEEARRREEDARRAAEEEVRRAAEEERNAAEAVQEAERTRLAAEAEAAAPQQARPAAPATARAPDPARPGTARAPAATPRPGTAPATTETLRLRPTRPEDEEAPRRRPGVVLPPRKMPAAPVKKGSDPNRRPGRIDVQAAIEGDDDKTRSLASVRRQRERERRQQELEALRANQVKIVRDVILPDTITVQELANRMAARTPDVVKALMRMGVMANMSQLLDADTAELVIGEFGHRARRVSDSDVETGIEVATDVDVDMLPRPPVVTIMGHVDHGKTSLLDALRATDVAAGEAGGITQHIGAYTVKMPSGAAITFLDTPGHEAFTAMRSRGAQVTDIVVLVVAGDDGVMPQTIEAIRHAKAADAPIIVAINKMDKADANPARVRQELLSHEIVVEEMGGETQDVEVSATKKMGLDKLEEAILLQAEVLDLRANPDRLAEGAVVESRLDRGRGPVATILVQKGTLKQGDLLVAGAEWGKVRAMLDDKGRPLKVAGPSTPVEVLGLSGVPTAGEPFVVVESETQAREVSEFRQRKLRDKASAGATAARGTLEEMLARIQGGGAKEVALVIKADVQGSSEAITATVGKLAHEEVAVRVLLAGVGQITESDIQLAKASQAVIIAFNVRATSQAREMAQRDGVDIRYYSIIYEVADDIEKLVRGKVAPKARERFLGYAEIRKVFDITKTGKVAGCMVTEGLVKRGAGVRLLRDNVVIHSGDLSQLKRFKDDVREVARGYECGLSFAGFSDLREGDMVECFEVEMVPG